MFNSVIHAGFSFSGADEVLEPIVLNGESGAVSENIELGFYAQCHQSCNDYQDFRIGVSSKNIGSGYGSAPSLSAEGLDYFINPVEFTLTSGKDNYYSPTTRSFSVGNWTSAFYVDDEDDPEKLKGSLSFKLSRTAAEAFYDEDDESTHQLVFYITGEDVYSSRAYDSLKVTIPLEKAPQVQITKLDNIELDQASYQNGFYRGETGFCVYSSAVDNKYQIAIETRSTANTSNGRLRLMPSNSLNYQMRFKSGKQSDSWTEFFDSAIKLGAYTGSSDSNCNSSNNAWLQVSIDSASADIASPGIYQDTVYVTVSPGL